MRTNTRRVALFLLSGSTYANEAKTGIYRYAHTAGQWDVVDFDGRSIQDAMDGIRRWSAAGLMVCLESGRTRYIRELEKLGLPIVNLTNQIPVSEAANVHVCPHSLAELAHDHFTSLSVKNFGYFCIRNYFNITTEQVAYRARLAEHGESLESFQADLAFAEVISDEPELHSGLVTWIQSLPKPIGILCDSDQSAIYLGRACQRLGLSIPYDVAILGISNDHRARLAAPPVSSIVCPAERIGYEAAKQLDQILDGQTGREKSIAVRATEVMVRASTRPEMMDPNISAAMEYIQEHAPRGISVSDVMTTQSVSRVTFERRFKLVTGRSPGAEIRRLRLERIKELLLCSQLKANEIAQECGFESATNLSLFFKKATGKSPIAFRNEHALT